MRVMVYKTDEYSNEYIQCPKCGGDILFDAIVDKVQNDEMFYCYHCSQPLASSREVIEWLGDDYIYEPSN